MSTEAKLDKKKSARQSSAPSSAPEVLSGEMVSPWEQYLTGKKVSAIAFLRKMESARKKTGIEIPDDAIKDRFATVFIAKPDRIVRVLGLLQSCGQFNDTLQTIVVDFAWACIKRLNAIHFPESLDESSFRDAVLTWMGQINKKPLKAPDLNLMLLILQFGWHLGVLSHDTALSLIAKAVTKPVKTRFKKKPVRKSPLTPIEAILNTTPTVASLSACLGYAEASLAKNEELNSQIRIQKIEIARLTKGNDELNAEIEELNSKIKDLHAQNDADELRITEVENRIVDLRDGHRHKMDELRGQIRGMLQGQLTRWLQTALDASRSDPPWTLAIQERLEDALQLIEKESKCLQPSE